MYVCMYVCMCLYIIHTHRHKDTLIKAYSPRDPQAHSRASCTSSSLRPHVPHVPLIKAYSPRDPQAHSRLDLQAPLYSGGIKAVLRLY